MKKNGKLEYCDMDEIIRRMPKDMLEEIEKCLVTVDIPRETNPVKLEALNVRLTEVRQLIKEKK